MTDPADEGAAAPRRRRACARRRWGLALAALVVCGFPDGGVARGRDESAPRNVVADPEAAPSPSLDPFLETGDGSRRTSGPGLTPLVAPIPFYNTQIGWGVFLLGGVIHRFDPDPKLKPSTGAVGAMVSDNGSWGVMAMEMARLRGDTWRMRGLVGYMDLRYDYYGIGEEAGDAREAVPLEQEFTVGTGAVLRRVATGLYVGGTVMWLQSTVALRDGANAAALPDLEDREKTGLFAPGLQAEYDTRDDDYWPVHGSLGKLRASFFLEALGGSREFQRYQAVWCWYTPLRGNGLVLATNAQVAVAPGDAPFYALCALGTGRYALRGYTQGRYRDQAMTTVQAEVRAHTSGRWGATAFGGFGQVAPDGGGIFSAEMLWAGGLGLRFQLTRKYPMHLRFDYAWGRDENLFYFGVSEAF